MNKEEFLKQKKDLESQLSKLREDYRKASEPKDVGQLYIQNGKQKIKLTHYNIGILGEFIPKYRKVKKNGDLHVNAYVFRTDNLISCNE